MTTAPMAKKTPAETLDQFIDQLTRQSREADEHCDKINRDRQSLDRLVFLSAGRSEPMASLGAFVDFAGRVTDLGFNSIVVHDRVSTDPALDFEPNLARIARWDRAA